MRARVQDVQPIDCNGQQGYGVTLLNESDMILMTVAFATVEEANIAAEQLKSIIASAIFAASPSMIPIPTFGRRRTDVTGIINPPPA